MSYFLGFCAAFATLRFVKLLRFNKRIIVFLHAFTLSLKELSSFGACFLTVWLGFVHMFFILYNSQLADFASMPASMATCFQMILGRGSALFVKEGSLNLMGVLLFVLFNVGVIFVLMNIFLTIINEKFAEACRDSSLDAKDPQLFDYLKNVLGSVLGRPKRKDLPSEHSYKDFWDTLPHKFDEFLGKFERVI